MKNLLLGPMLVALTVTAPAAWGQTPGFLPGCLMLMDAHNCSPYEGLWTDRVDWALSAGMPVGIEIDLAWDPAPTSGAPRIVVCHGGRAKGDDPTLENYFFEKVRPLVERALKEGNRGQWPLVTLNINDLRPNAPEFLSALWTLMGTYEAWVCTATKTAASSGAMRLCLGLNAVKLW